MCLVLSWWFVYLVECGLFECMLYWEFGSCLCDEYYLIGCGCEFYFVLFVLFEWGDVYFVDLNGLLFEVCYCDCGYVVYVMMCCDVGYDVVLVFDVEMVLGLGVCLIVLLCS